MANKKITQLNSLNSASLANNDLFVVVDIDAVSTPTGETKHITATEFYGYLREAGLADSSSYSTTSSWSATSVSSSYAVTASYSLSSETQAALLGLNIISVDPLGSDVTGNLTSPFATIGGAFNWLQNRRILSGSVEIHVQTGSYAYTSPEVLYHVDAQKISIIGNNGSDLSTVSTTVAKYSSVTSNGDANHTASIDVGSTIYNASSVGDYLMISDINTNTINDAGSSANTRGLCGVWPIISKGGGTVLNLFTTFQTNTAAGRFSATPNLTAKLLKTKLNFTGTSGIVVDSCNLKSIRNLVVVGLSQNQTLNNGGDGISVGQFKNTLDESVTDVAGFYITRKGYASLVASDVGVYGFAHSGFSARNGSLTALYCSATNNYYGFEADNANKLDAPHSTANGNGHSGFFANNRSTLNAKYCSACYNLYYGMVSDEGSTIICDNLSNTDKCTFIGPNGFSEAVALNGSQLTMNGTYVRSYGAASSSMQPLDDYYVVGAANGSNITAQYCRVADLQNGIEARNNSVVVFDSSYMEPQKIAAKVINGSSLSLGNAEINKLTANINYLVQIINGSTVNVPACNIESGGSTYSASFYITDNSSLNMDAYYNFDSGKVATEVTEFSPYSLTIDQDQGEQIRCDNNSVAVIHQLSGSAAGGYYQLLSQNGSLIRVKQDASSSVSHYPNSAIPYGSDLGRVVFDNMS